MMRRLVLHPTQTAQWHSLVCDAEKASNLYLDEDLQSYLVFLLMRFLDKPDMAAKILAREYLDSLLSSGQRQQEQLRNVGDVCLLHAGLFPRRALRKRVSENYFTELGCGAYEHLSMLLEHEFAGIYHRLSQSFESLRDLLKTMRQLGEAANNPSTRFMYHHPQNDDSQKSQSTLSGAKSSRFHH